MLCSAFVKEHKANLNKIKGGIRRRAREKKKDRILHSMPQPVLHNPFRKALSRLRSSVGGLAWRGGAGSGLMCIEPTGRIGDGNPIAARLLGKKDLRGVYLQTLCDGRDRDRLEEALNATASAGRASAG